MIRKALTIFTLLFLFQAPNALAHGGGHGPIDEGQARALAADVTHQFADSDPGLGFGTLAASWKEIDPEAVKMHVKGAGYYIVSLENKTEGKTLYILMSATGSVFDANFTGEFPKVK
ncbi:DUF6488 family protein [Thiohalomonas denitrificans]|uniref:Peptidase propeptide and YPEB domain-containing protein n=1 Tax=Thiohalomonas denitrificans TaxID=415747 RepID=A0A1G5R1Q7_9GAMM|nr:DUF6488 family protein [Thiohalomonas denitrificans]SCZ67886.1 hypothetical protein SAMN03097708_03222 [Thiohalomonas denitrificans]